MINPLLVEGQMIGGIVQGAGQAMMEDLVYDKESGQLITGSFQDYCMPRADDFSMFELWSENDPDQAQPARRQGCGRGRHVRRDAGRHERGERRAVPCRRGADRDAGDSGKGLARAQHQRRGAVTHFVIARRAAPKQSSLPGSLRCARDDE